MSAEWHVYVRNASFTLLGEFVNVNQLKVDAALNKVRTFQMKIGLDNVLAPVVAVNSGIEPLYFEAVRNGAVLFDGPLMTMQETCEETKSLITVNAAGPESIFASRLVATTNATTQVEGIKYAAGTQRAVRFKELLAESNARTNGETHIDYSGTAPYVIESSATGAYESASFRTLMEVLTDLYRQAEGFDWYVKPQAPASSKIGKLLAKDVIGAPQKSAAFDWGGGRNNVAKANRTADLTKLMTQGWNVSSAGPEATGAPTVKKTDTAAMEKWGLREDMVPLSALNNNFREVITQEALTYRKKPKQTVTFDPVNDDGTGHVPQFEVDFGLGDSVPLRIIYNEVEHLNALLRCWGASFSLDENGKETQTILTAEE